ncbi:MAG: MarR family transcriptional regulator [Solirubrobacterales bacterium]
MNSGPLSGEELAAWRGMLEVNSRLTHRLDAEMQAAHGLSLSAYEVLMFLEDAPGQRLRMSEIADRALLSRSGCTRLVDRLAKLGYVTRCAAEGDGRGLFAELTDAGRERIAAARPTHRAGIRAHFLAHLSAAERRALARIWARVLGEPA